MLKGDRPTRDAVLEMQKIVTCLYFGEDKSQAPPIDLVIPSNHSLMESQRPILKVKEYGRRRGSLG